ncbi:electron transfer flavoprotein subunit alpha/FixB family protein [Notoacmeibacter ruber]|uniref:Electron transfer flavoprotein subunit alpha/FixB family protein n=1 Tax=Notoacmeibacter ruber TaxID=2670375 RepID=A0A3L7JBS8_9HYPH|nr:electron transfer flavoprotein subunit alpha/FixB family protein [Notoacmeibacter ruber]RLQ87894.1 electron transfer flavoprotein subunit alpha/FixB family protein [Notoacmeibacter ruber]
MSRDRRDPRAEKIAQFVPVGATRPRYDRARQVRSSGRPRRDPRTIFATARVPGQGRVRIDRSQHVPLVSGVSPQVKNEPATPVIRIVEEPAFLVFAVLDADGGRLSRFDRQVLGAARLLADAKDGGGAVVALVGGDAENLGQAGADRLVVLGETDVDASCRASQILSVMNELEPRHILFPESLSGGDLARRLAMRSGERLMSDVEHLTARQSVRACGGGRGEQASAPPRLMSIGEDRVAAYMDRPCEARPIEIVTLAPEQNNSILKSEVVPADPSSMSLAEADFVVSAGNGVTDFEAFRELSHALKATPGASRVVCDAGLMPREAQVGASGTVLSADCYLAMGIAGAPQHLQGIAGCEHVIAVNTDLHAAMVERAGLAIVQDAQKVMPALLRILGERNA